MWITRKIRMVLFNKLICSQTRSEFYSRPLLCRPAVVRTVAALVVLSLLPTSTPAATVTIVVFATESKASLGFWFRSLNLLTQVSRRLSPEPENEKQSARDSRVDRIVIFPDDVTVHEGQKINYVAVAYDNDGNTVSGVNFKWKAWHEERGREVAISPRGDFNAIAEGNFKVSVEGAARRATTRIKIVEGKRRRKDDDKVLDVKTVSSRDLPPGALGSIRTNSKATDTLARTSKQPEASSKSLKEKFSHSKSRTGAKASTPAAPFFLDDGWGDSNYWSADDPENRRGNPPGAPIDGGAGSGNFQKTAPILSLPGRGIDISLALTYNSRLWNKADNNINFDIDRDWPALGWSLGFGKMLAISINHGFMLIDPDGTRHSFTGTIQFFNWGTIGTFHTTDGSLIDYNYTTGTNGIVTSAEARYPNGTVITYGAHSSPGGGVFPTSIRDANGNYITITYVNNQGPRIQTATDTLGRVITFHYDSLNRLTAITAPDLGTGTRTLVRLHYSQLTLGYNFSGLTAIVRDAAPWVIDAIYYPGTGTGYWFDQSSGAYSSYGMLRRVSERRGMTFSGPSPVPPGQGTTEQGTITAGQITNEEFYNYPLNTGDLTGTPGSNLTDAPTFTSSTESWTRDGTSTMDQAVTTYNVTQTTGVRTTTITQPTQTKVVQYSHNLPGNFLDGLIYEDQTLDSADNLLQKSTVTWEQGAYESARPTRIEAITGSNPKTATEFTYGTVYNQVTDLRSYDFGGTTLLKSTRTQYQNSSNYTNRHIFSLPLVVEVFASDNTTRVSRTEYQYDGQPLANTPGVIMHDDAYNPHFEPILMPGDCYWDCMVPAGEPCIWTCDPDWWFNPYNAATDYRGNVTQETSYVDAVDLTGAVIETNRYDMTGNVITTSNSCCQQTSTTFTVDSYYAHPISETRGSDTDGFSQVTTSAAYDFNTSLVISTTDADNRTSLAGYDPATLRVAIRTLPTGAHTDYVYDETAMTVTETTYIQSHPTHTTITSQSVRVMNGRGDVRQEKSLAAGGAFDLVDTVYDSMGRVSQESRPYHSGDTLQWTTTTYDALNRIISVQHPDGSTMQSFYNEASRPNVASASPGETTRIQDAWGRERWSREDSSGRTVEIVEPNPAGNGSVATGGLVTTYAYNTLDDLVLVTQGEQTRSFKYDSLGRLIAQKSAEANAKLNDAGVYVGSGTWSDVFTYDDRSNMISHTDARGVKTIFNYNGDPLNRLQSVSWDTSGFGDTANPVLAAPTVTYQYRTKSSGTQLLDVEQVSGFTVAGVSTEAYTFDTEGRMSSKTVTVTNRASYPMVMNYNYDALDRVSEIQYPAEYGNGTAPRRIVTPSYDVASHLSGLTVAGHTHASDIVYNASSQPTSLKVGASGANQITENYTFNAQTGLLDGQTITRGASTLLNLSYDYADANGKRTGQLKKILNNLNHNKDRAFNYDALGRLVQATGGPSASPLWTQTYVYDRYGNRTSVSASGFSAKNERRTTEQPRDLIAKNTFELPAFLHNDTKSVSDSPLKLREPNASTAANNLSTSRGPFLSGPPTFTDDPLVAGTTVVKGLHVTELRDAINLLRTRVGLATVSWAEPVSAGVLIKASHIIEMRTRLEEARTALALSPTSYTDPSLTVGTLVKTAHIQQIRDSLKATWNVSSQISLDGHASLSYEATSNRITTAGFEYDAAGNQVRALRDNVLRRFQYDAANRLVRVKADDNVTIIASYTYSSDNQRLIAEEGGERRYFLTDRGGVAAELAEGSGSTTPAWSRSYVYLGGRLLSTLTPNASGGLFVDYHHPDHLGTRVVSNAQDTTSIEQVTLPFGTSIDSESSGSTNRRFTSYERSNNTKLDYAVNRYYDSQQGRFTQVDPLGAGAASVDDPQSFNMYGYVGNDPINRTDHHGLFFKSFFKWLGKALKWIALAAMVATAIITVVGSVIGAVALKTFLTTTLLGKILAFTAHIPDIIGGFISGLPKAIAGIFNFAERGTAIVTRVIGYMVLMGGSAVAGAIGDQLEKEAQKETGKARRRREKAERRMRRERPATRPRVRAPGLPEIKTEPRIGRPEVRVPPKPQIPVQNPSRPTLPVDATKWQKFKFGVGQGLRILGQYIKGSPIMIIVDPEALQEIACQENPYSRECIYGPFPGCCKIRRPMI